MKLKDLFEEYGAIRTGVINCDDEGCKICIEDKERMAEIIKEVEASIRKEVAQEEIERWTKVFDYHHDMSNEIHVTMRNCARVEIQNWNNKLSNTNILTQQLTN